MADPTATELLDIMQMLVQSTPSLAGSRPNYLEVFEERILDQISVTTFVPGAIMDPSVSGNRFDWVFVDECDEISRSKVDPKPEPEPDYSNHPLFGRF